MKSVCADDWFTTVIDHGVGGAVDGSVTVNVDEPLNGMTERLSPVTTV
jgi:hypothetical protein